MERRKDNTIQMGGGASAVYLYKNRISGIKAAGGTQAVTMCTPGVVRWLWYTRDDNDLSQCARRTSTGPKRR